MIRILTHNRDYLRMRAALMVLESGDTDAAIPVLATTLPVGSEEYFGRLAVKAVDQLLRVGSPEAIKAAVGVLINPAIRRPDSFSDFHEHFRATIVTALAKAGHPEGYKLYLVLLDVKGDHFGQTTYGDPPAQQAVTEILEILGKNDRELQKLREIRDFETRRLAVRRWVEAKMK